MIDKSVKMVNHATFLEDGELYLKLVYEVEDEYCRRRITMPKISLGFFKNKFPELKSEIIRADELADAICVIPERYISNHIGDFPLCNYGYDEACLYEEILEERYEELTMDEIENRLGHKIKIVKGNKK